jgi:hypothetical protein
MQSSRLLDTSLCFGASQAQAGSFSPAQRPSLSVPVQQSVSAGGCSSHLRPGYFPILLRIGAAPASIWHMMQFVPEFGGSGRLRRPARPHMLESLPVSSNPRSAVPSWILRTDRRSSRPCSYETQPAAAGCVNRLNWINKGSRLSSSTAHRTTPVESERRGRPRPRHRRNRKCIFWHDSLHSIADFLRP